MSDLREDEQASWINLGPLDELNFMMKAQLVNSMLIDEWDFIKYPNPQVFLGQLKGAQNGN